MAKKKNRDINLSPAQMVLPGEPQVEEAGKAEKKKVAETAAASQSGRELNEEYHYVIAELKRIGIIAAVMVVILIVLALTLT